MNRSRVEQHTKIQAHHLERAAYVYVRQSSPRQVQEHLRSAANLNIHLHCLVLDGVYRTTDSGPVFHPVQAPTAEQLQALLIRMIKRLVRLLTRKGYLVEEQAMTYLVDPDPESALTPLQAAACTLPHRVRTARRAKGADLANPPEPSGAAGATTLRQRTGL